jgi:hypothetical protein
MGPVNYASGTASGWYYHVAVIKEGMVFDKMTGVARMPPDKYIAMFEDSSELLFTTVKKTKF